MYLEIFMNVTAINEQEVIYLKENKKIPYMGGFEHKKRGMKLYNYNLNKNIFKNKNLNL